MRANSAQPPQTGEELKITYKHRIQQENMTEQRNTLARQHFMRRQSYMFTQDTLTDFQGCKPVRHVQRMTRNIINRRGIAINARTCLIRPPVETNGNWIHTSESRERQSEQLNVTSNMKDNSDEVPTITSQTATRASAT
jgi:hypothetical protein